MDVNKFLHDAMISYIKSRRLSEINSDLEDFVKTREEEILQTKDISFTTVEFTPTYIGTGSSSEGLGCLGNDFDTMALLPNKFIKFDGNTLNDTPLLADMSQSPPGFCRLIVIPEYLSSFSTGSVVLENGQYYLNREAYRTEIQENTEFLEGANIQGPSFELLPDVDHVPVIKCLDWPQQCKEYFQRERFWPSVKKLVEIRENGIHVVFKSFSDDLKAHDPLEFRTSYALAEKTLMRNLSDLQFATYYLLKTIKGEIAAYCDDDHTYLLKSYFIKTTLIQFTETTPPNVWREENFLKNTKTCFEMLLGAFKIRYLPHVFIKGCNLLSKYSVKQCDCVARDLSKYLSNWESEVWETFFWKVDKKLTRPCMMRTRQQCRKMFNAWASAYGSDYDVSCLSLCLEADLLSMTLVASAGEHCGSAYVEALFDLSECLHKFMPPSYVTVYNVILERLTAVLVWKRCSNRKNTSLILSLLFYNNITITYPISGFVDRISSNVWLAFYSYVIGEKYEAFFNIRSIENLDEESPVGHMSVHASDLEKQYFHFNDPFLYELLDRFLGKDDDFCPINCVVLAQYLKAKLIRIEDKELRRSRLAALQRTMEIVNKVWKVDKYRSIQIDLIQETMLLYNV